MSLYYFQNLSNALSDVTTRLDSITTELQNLESYTQQFNSDFNAKIGSSLDLNIQDILTQVQYIQGNMWSMYTEMTSQTIVLNAMAASLVSIDSKL